MTIGKRRAVEAIHFGRRLNSTSILYYTSGPEH